MKEIRLADLPEHPEVTKQVLRARKAVSVVGAGISTASGIPDFRGAAGIYTKDRMSLADYFDATVAFSSEDSRRSFLAFMSKLSGDVEAANPTATHAFLKALDEHGKLARVYSQNIDYLEERAGLRTGIDKTHRVIQLHGSLSTVACGLPGCTHKEPLTPRIRQDYAQGVAPPCPNCRAVNEVKTLAEKRVGASGALRPAVVLYNEPHPYEARIAETIATDARRRPDLLLIMGTSLKIPGCKALIKHIGQVVHERGGLVLFVNSTSVKPSEWDSLIDYHIVAKTDDFSRHFHALVDKEEGKRADRKRKRQLRDEERRRRKEEEGENDPDGSDTPSSQASTATESEEIDVDDLQSQPSSQEAKRRHLVR